MVPGPALSYFGMLCAYWTDTSTLTSGKMWLWGVLTAVVTALDYILPAYFSKMFGGSRAGIIGATVGVFAGMILLGPLGIVLGPFVGAVAGELLHDRENADKALKVGFGSLVSFFFTSFDIALQCRQFAATPRGGLHIAKLMQIRRCRRTASILKAKGYNYALLRIFAADYNISCR